MSWSAVDGVSSLFGIPENMEKVLFSSGMMVDEANEKRRGASGAGGIPVDILDTPNEYVFYLDVPGLSKSDIQVTVEDENTLVIKGGGGGKRKREEGVEEGCKYLRLERRSAHNKVMRKFRLPENANVSAISAKCENGVLTIVVEKLPPPTKPKTVQVSIS